MGTKLNGPVLMGRIVVITGASSGFGRGAALAFAREGAHLVLAARRADLLNEVVRQCEAAGVNAIAVPTNVSNHSEVAQLAEVARDTFSRVDVWVNGAGVAALGNFEDIPIADHQQVIATNLMGTLYGSHEAIRIFTGQGHGTLINIASELGKHPVPYYSSYTAAKHGVVGLSASIRQELMQRPELAAIHVCNIIPTAHDTPFFDHVANYTGREVNPPEPLHDPFEVVSAIVETARRPTDEAIIGGDGVLKVALRSLLPSLAEKVTSKQMHRTQIELPPAAGDTPGALHAPVPKGTTVRGGWRERKVNNL